MIMSASERSLADHPQSHHTIVHRIPAGPMGRHRQINISENERWVSGLGGGALALYGVSLIYRGVTGHCDIYHALGISTSEKGGLNASVRHGEGIKVEKSVT